MGRVMCPYGLVSRCVLPYFSGWVVGKSVGAVVGLPYPAASPHQVPQSRMRVMSF